MVTLLVGLALFVVVHSVRIVAPNWRAAQVARWGVLRWRLMYSVLSVAGFVAMAWGFERARAASAVLWVPTLQMRHVTVGLMALACMLWVSAFMPASHVRAKLQHPGAAGVSVWAAAHLLANGRLVDALLFGSLLVWSVLSFAAGRGSGAATSTPGLRWQHDALAVALGALGWLIFARFLHAPLIGVAPLG